MSPRDRRFPASVFGVGAEPDARFTLANERTFLAWIRTGLALVAGGVALETLGLDLHPGLRLAASVVLIVGGIVVPLIAWTGWMRVERALRRGAPLPSTVVGVCLAVVVAAVGVLVLLGVLLR
ncbi:YidH family protein [Promicromonospora sp. NPDC050880]|uniref:YidH family protein n=1 Tax=unclassified Promicromonospora TaxID=2647929 RepID=UPI0037A6B311